MIALAIAIGLEGGSTRRAAGSDAPTVVVRPELIGQGGVGATLQVTPAVFSGVPEPVVQIEWRRDGALIAGENTLSYTLQPGDAGSVIYACFVAQNAAGQSEACTPLMPVWPNQSVEAWCITSLGPASMRIKRAPAPPPLPTVTGGASIEIT